MTDAVATPQPAVTNPLSVLAMIALVVAVVDSLLYLLVKTLAVAIPYYSGDPTTTGIVFGVLGILSFFPAGIAVVLGHLGLRETKSGVKRGRVMAAVALGIGYLQLAMWANRLIVAGIAASASGDIGQFVPNIFWWV